MHITHTTKALGLAHGIVRASVCVLVLTSTWRVQAEQGSAQGQAQRGGQGRAQAIPAEAASGRVRVPTSYANIHTGPSSVNEVIVLAPKGTVLTVTGRDKEWIQVQLTPELRKTGMVIRWYKNEDRGWMHDSTVEVAKPIGQRGAPPK